MSSNQQLLLGEGAGGGIPNYIEEVFSTYLYTGNGSTQTITNGIDLSTKGGLVWLKSRSAAYGNRVQDTVRGAGSGKALRTNGTEGETASNSDLTAFTSSGFSLGYVVGDNNASGTTNVSWTFRKQKKFFDVVTYTGDGTTFQTVSHNLGSEPGCIIAKRTDTTGNWVVYHRSIATDTLRLNLTDAKTGLGGAMLPSSTSIDFYGSGGSDPLNASGGTYVAYLFAHNAGGFGLAGTDNVISCGSYTGTGAVGNTITVGYEPQWVMIKASSGTSAAYQDWYIYDNMRGMPVGTAIDDQRLMANLSSAEASYPEIGPTATGFVCEATGARLNESGTTYIYIAIRRGPMKVPTVGTSVFAPVARTGTGTNPTVVTTNTNPDLLMSFPRTASPAAYGTVFFDKLRGVSQILQSANTNAEATTTGTFVLQSFLNTGFQTGADFIQGYLNYSGSTYAQYAMTRAPGFFDEVCYTGTGVARTVTHNLTVAPELMIVKTRSGAGLGWYVYSTGLGPTKMNQLNQDVGSFTSTGYWNDTAPTSSVFSLGDNVGTNGSGNTQVAYLFATCAGVSKVGSYTGNGSSQTIACGFAAGSRFVMIKRTDSTGDWYVWDSARGIVAGNDPHLSLNTTAAEVTTDDSVDTDNSGFIVNQDAATNVNVTSATYIFLAIS